MRIESVNDATQSGVCAPTCTVLAAPGRYRFHVLGAGKAWRPIEREITGPGTIFVERPDPGVRALGHAFALTGGAAVAGSLGFAAVTVALCMTLGEAMSGAGGGCNLRPLESELPLLAGVAVSGVLLGVAGVALISATNAPDVEFVPMRPGSVPAVAVKPSPPLLGVTFRF